MYSKMAVFILTAVLSFTCVIALAGDKPDIEKQEQTQVQIVLNKYNAEGYSVLGPVQYLGRSFRTIKLYRHDPVKYSGLEIIAEDGARTEVQKYDRVYVLSKGKQVVLVRLEPREEVNA